MLGVLCIIGCPVQLIRVAFWDCIFVVDTHLPRFEALAYVLPHFDALTHVVIRVPSAFIFQTFAEVCYSVFVNRSSFNLRMMFVKRVYLRVCWRSTIDLCLMNLPKSSSFKSVLKVYTLSKILLWTGLTRTASPGWINSDRLGSNKKIKKKKYWTRIIKKSTRIIKRKIKSVDFTYLSPAILFFLTNSWLRKLVLFLFLLILMIH